MTDGTKRVEARRGFFPVVIGDEVSVSQAGGGLFASRGDIHLRQGGARRVVFGPHPSLGETRHDTPTSTHDP